MAEVYVKGMRELSAAFAHAGPDVRKELRESFKEVARPIAGDAESLASGGISHIGTTWPKMRIGVTRSLVYVAPKQRGVGKGGSGNPRRRPNLARLLMVKAMTPALQRNVGQIERAAEHALDRIVHHFD